jgi:hypothetical protein
MTLKQFNLKLCQDKLYEDCVRQSSNIQSLKYWKHNEGALPGGEGGTAKCALNFIILKLYVVCMEQNICKVEIFIIIR